MPATERFDDRSDGLAYDLIHSGAVSLRSDLSQADVDQALAPILTADPKDVTTAGAYVLRSITLARAVTGIRTGQPNTLLLDCLQINTNDPVTVCVPCVGRGHYHLAIIQLQNKKITNAVLWDPKGNPNNTAQLGDAFAVFSELINTFTDNSVEPRLHNAGRQASTNDYSCGDYVVQAAYQVKGVRHPIVDAKPADVLRLEVTKEIARNCEELGDDLAEQLEIRDGKVQAQPEPGMSDELIERRINDIFSKDAANQSVFDEIFARRLQATYDANPKAVNEKPLVQQARVDALGIFARRPNPATEAASATAEASAQPGLK